MLDWVLSIYILVCFFVTVIGGFIPFFIKFLPNKKIATQILDVCSASAGGLFLSGGLMHMLAEGIELIDQAGYNFGGFPIGFFFIVVVTHSHASFEDVDKSQSSSDYNIIDDEEVGISQQNDDSKQSKHYHHHKEDEDKGWCSVITLIFALSLHSFFEGLGLGVSTSPTAIFIAIAGHKWADSGFTVIFLMTKVQSLAVVSVIILIFSTFTPIGSLVGVFVIEMMGDTSASELVQGILICLASGTFLYVAIVEILAEAFEKEKFKFLKFTLAVVLFVAMSLVTLLED
ncbi:Zinc transporter [Entamoeba marina]